MCVWCARRRGRIQLELASRLFSLIFCTRPSAASARELRSANVWRPHTGEATGRSPPSRSPSPQRRRPRTEPGAGEGGGAVAAGAVGAAAEGGVWGNDMLDAGWDAEDIDVAGGGVGGGGADRSVGSSTAGGGGVRGGGGGVEGIGVAGSAGPAGGGDAVQPSTRNLAVVANPKVRTEFTANDRLPPSDRRLGFDGS